MLKLTFPLLARRRRKPQPSALQPRQADASLHACKLEPWAQTPVRAAENGHRLEASRRPLKPRFVATEFMMVQYGDGHAFWLSSYTPWTNLALSVPAYRRTMDAPCEKLHEISKIARQTQPMPMRFQSILGIGMPARQ